ncbi:hypothetical protein JF69_00980 [Bifidobacterium kimbladii]|uniref:Uncharacterized protein n=1 Tax=Bifidobacterium asteroides TaxID=1684 RepID=A0A0F4L5U9_9BIFI|nr:hypothetical protein JF69_00980 [Bifidobacterium asteroides]
MSGYMDHAAKVGLLRILACFIRFPSPACHSRKATASVGMKSHLQTLPHIPLNPVPLDRQFSLKSFSSVKGLTVRSARWATIAKDGTNHGVALFVFPRLIEAYVQTFAHFIRCEEVLSKFAVWQEIYDVVCASSTCDYAGDHRRPFNGALTLSCYQHDAAPPSYSKTAVPYRRTDITLLRASSVERAGHYRRLLNTSSSMSAKQSRLRSQTVLC